MKMQEQTITEITFILTKEEAEVIADFIGDFPRGKIKERGFSDRAVGILDGIYETIRSTFPFHGKQ